VSGKRHLERKARHSGGEPRFWVNKEQRRRKGNEKENQGKMTDQKLAVGGRETQDPKIVAL